MAKKRGRKRSTTETNIAAAHPEGAAADSALEPLPENFPVTAVQEQPQPKQPSDFMSRPSMTPDLLIPASDRAAKLWTEKKEDLPSWKAPPDYFALSAQQGAFQPEAQIEQYQKPSPTPKDVEDFLEQVERAKHDSDFRLLETAAAKFLEHRKMLSTKRDKMVTNNMAEIVADLPVQGTKQLAGQPTTMPAKPMVGDAENSAPANRGAGWGDSGSNWQSTDLKVDKEIQVEPLSEKSTKFIENLRESIINAGVTESIIKVETAEVMDRDPQLSGEWRPVEGQNGEEDAERPVLPPAALRKQSMNRKQSVEVPKVSLEERLVGENITASEIEEEEKFRLQRLKDKTTGGQYHIYLLIYAACILLAYGAQHFSVPDMQTAMASAGKSVAASVDRLMLPSNFATFANGMKYYEDEASKGSTKKFNFFTSVGTGLGAAFKVATTEPSGSFSPKRKAWYQLPTGFFFGVPAAALYTVRQIAATAVSNKTALELLLTGLIYLAMIGMAGMVFMRAQRRWSIFPMASAPVVILILLSVTSMLVSAVMTFSASICRGMMPDTIQLFTALAVIGISGMASRLAFFGKKAKTSVRH